MNYSEKLVEFLDGELDSLEAQELFERLAIDVDLQVEMQEMVSLKNMVKSTMITPPDSLKTGILKKTGLKNNLLRNSAFIASFMLVFFLGAASNFLLFNNDESEFIANNKYENSEPLTFNISVPVEVNEKLTPTLKSTNYVRNTPMPTSTMGAEFIEENVNQLSTLNLNPISFVSFDEINIQNEVSNINDKYSPTSYRTLMNEGDVVSSNRNLYALEFRKVNSNSLHSFNLNDVGGPSFNNFAVALYYRMNSNFQVGLELGRENFIQKYSERVAEFKNRLFEQEITSLWGGLAARYNSDQYDFLLGGQVYSKAFVGGISTGPFGRFELGLQYPFVENARLFVGFELSHTIYSHERALFHTSKFGPSFGLIFDL